MRRTDKLNILEALEWLKEGAKLRREIWTGNTHIVLFQAGQMSRTVWATDDRAKMDYPARLITTLPHGEKTYEWKMDAEDLLATDWAVVI